MAAPDQDAKKTVSPGLKLVLEMGPLVAFFVTNYKFGIFPATGVLMNNRGVAFSLDEKSVRNRIQYLVHGLFFQHPHH